MRSRAHSQEIKAPRTVQESISYSESAWLKQTPPVNFLCGVRIMIVSVPFDTVKKFCCLDT